MKVIQQLIPTLLLYIILGLLYSCQPHPENLPTEEVQLPQEIKSVAIQQLMDSFLLKGTVLIFDVDSNTYISNDFERARTGFLPASTFKVPNSMIALETGVVEDDSTMFYWDGKDRLLDYWEKDMTFKEAYHRSCVPCYQEIARKVGTKRMQSHLDTFKFGQMVVDSLSIDKFWLEGDSRISAFEQIDFLQRFNESKLPISNRTEALMKEIMILKNEEGYILRGKTGWSIREGWNVGWFVGILEVNERTYYLATNVEPTPAFNMDEFPRVRLEITMKTLEQLSLL